MAEREGAGRSQARERDRDRFFVQKDKHPVFQRLSQDEAAPFKHMKDVWVLAAAMGFRASRRRRMVGGTQHVGFWHYLSSQEDVPLLQAIAVAETGDVSVLANRGEMIRIAEEYANGGIDLLVDEERPDREGTLRSLAATIVQELDRQEKGSARQAVEETRDDDVMDLVRRGESKRLEFKESARWNERIEKEDKADPRLEREVFKTVAGFLNAEGGTLLIGVHDSGEIVGIERDYQTLTGRPNKDGYENWLTDLLDNSLGKPALANVAISFERIEEKEVCRLDVRLSSKPVYVSERVDGKVEESFYARLTNSTRKLTTKETIEYIASHWGNSG